MWLRGGAGEQGLQSMNFQSVGMFPWMQQRLDPTLLVNDHNQQYQAMLSAGLQNVGSVDPMRQQFMQFQQPPAQYLQQSTSHNHLLQLQQQQPISPTIPQAQTQVLMKNQPRNLLHQQLSNQSEELVQKQPPSYQDALQLQGDQMQQRQQTSLPCPPFPRQDFMDSGTKFSSSMAPIQNILSSQCPEGSGNTLNFSSTSHSMLSEQLSQQTWTPNPKYAQPEVNAFTNSMSLSSYPGKNAVVEQQNCSSDNPTLFGVNIDSSGLLVPSTVPNFTSSIDADVPSIPLGESGFQSPLYSCMQDSSELLHGAGQVDQSTPSRTFVKVYKSGSVGRSLDITRFSSYHELREELAQMFGIEGKLENPLRSGWQLVFVDRENDVLLLGDDPWEAFVNNVWYIKILSPEDVQKMGEQEIEPNAGQRVKSSGSGHLGSLEY